MRRLLGPLHVTGVFWYRAHRWAVVALPPWGIRVAVVLFTTFFFVALRRIRQAIASNLGAVLGPCGWLEKQRRIYRTLWSYAWCLTEHYEHLWTERKVTVTIDADQRLQSAGDAEGFVLVTAHVGQWEAGSMLAPAFEARKVHVVREAELDPKAQEFVEKQLAENGADGATVHFVDRNAAIGWTLLQVLRQGELVALQGDRPYAGGRTVRAKLFDKPLDLPVGPAALARSAGVELLPVFIFRESRSHARVVFRRPIRVSQDGDRAEAVERAVRQIADDVEWAIRRHPDQWFCFRDLWGSGGRRALIPR